MKSIKHIMLVGLMLLINATAVAEVHKLSAELANATRIVSRIDYKTQIIYVDGYELSYNANTKFVTQAGIVKPTALKPGSMVRFTVSDKNLPSLRTIVTKVVIRTQR